MVEVAPAANDSATNGSSAWCPPVAIHSSCGNGCSVTNTLVEPRLLGGAGHLGDRVGAHELGAARRPARSGARGGISSAPSRVPRCSRDRRETAAEASGNDGQVGSPVAGRSQERTTQASGTRSRRRPLGAPRSCSSTSHGVATSRSASRSSPTTSASTAPPARRSSWPSTMPSLVRRDPRTKAYSLGAALIPLGDAALSSLPVVDEARPRSSACHRPPASKRWRRSRWNATSSSSRSRAPRSDSRAARRPDACHWLRRSAPRSSRGRTRRGSRRGSPARAR